MQPKLGTIHNTKIAKHIFGWIHRICQVQIVDDSPLVLDLQSIILKELCYFSLH
jgi:hypothetical protein